MASFHKYAAPDILCKQKYSDHARRLLTARSPISELKQLVYCIRVLHSIRKGFAAEVKYCLLKMLGNSDK